MAVTYPGATTFPSATLTPGTTADGGSVVPPPEGLVTLAEAKQHLNITSSRHDLELGLYVEAVTAIIEEHVGAVVPRTVTEVLRGNVTEVAPVEALLSATRYGTVVTTGSLRPSGVAYGLRDGDTITYTAGYSPVPAAMKLAALVTLARLWETQRGSQPLPVAGGEPDGTSFVAQGGSDLPYRAQMLLAPYRRGSTVA